MLDKCIVRTEPDLQWVAEEFNKLCRTHVITIFCYCDVVYEGRAKSYLEWGDRLIISKPDGTLLVHGKIKREPINWQPPGSIPRMILREEKLELKSIRMRPKEILLVHILHVYAFTAMKMGLANFRLWASENDMVRVVRENPELIEEGFSVIDTEIKTHHGKIDLLGKDRYGNIVVCEFKRSIAQLEAVSQLKRYIDYFLEKGYTNVRGILVAPHITATAKELLTKYGLEFCRIEPPKETKEKPSIEWLR
ncbi:MAG: endonuclease NucS [Candidatus Njordarchaeales archaeon]